MTVGVPKSSPLLGAMVLALLAGRIAGQDTPEVDLGRHFEALAVRGTIIVCDFTADACHEHNPARNDIGFLPALTFKIPNSLIALEAGVVADQHEVLEWDGVDRGRSAWNQDLDLRRAFEVSGVWFYQELARRVGAEAMRAWLERIGYGNHRTGPEVDMFWLNGDLRISPREQVAFLKRLRDGDLPFSSRTLAIVKDVMIRDRGDAWVLRGKTGWTTAPDPDIGWFVGYVEQRGRVYYFATNIDVVADRDQDARVEISLRSLRSLGLLRRAVRDFDAASGPRLEPAKTGRWDRYS